MAITKAKLIADGVITVDNLHESHGITTTHIGEGNKLFYTDTRVSNYLSANNYITTSDVPNLETVTSLSISANILSYVNEAGITTNIDLSTYLDDTNLARLVSGTLNPGTGIATFTRDDLSTFTIDFSAFLADANDYVSSGSFNTSTGVLTLTRLGGGTVTVDLDGKYAEASHTHLWSHITDRPTALSAFTNDLGNYGGFLTSFTETDPIYTASSWYTTTNNASNWNTAYGWGNHASAGYLTSVTNVSGYSGELYSKDLRTISPSSHSSYRATFGFTSWANNGGAPYADYLHLRSYSDSSGGSDNLITFLKSGIGMRIWQQAWGSSTAYSSYVDVITSGNIGSQSVNYATSAGSATDSSKLPLSGGTLSGSLSISSGSLLVGNYGTAVMQSGALNIGRIDTNYGWDGGSWASDTRLGILANCLDTWEFGIHDSGESVESVFYYNSTTNDITMGRDLGWGTAPIVAADSFRAPIFYDSDNIGYYLDPASSGVSLKINGGVITTAPSGSVLLEHQVSEANAWIFKENATNWGLYWFNHGGASGQGIGGYTTVGAELFGMNAAVTGFNPPETWAGVDENTRAAWMLSNYSGYFWSQGTQYSETDMRAPAFYDINDTNYKADPASTSTLNEATFNRIGVGQGTNSNYRIIVSGDYYANAGGNYWAEGRFKQYRGSGTWHDVIDSGNIGSQSVSYATTARELTTNYAGGQQLNPQVYFNINYGLKVAMTAAWGYWSDTLWINGYAGGDVLQMCALHTQRNGQPRIGISVQASNSTSYGTIYELWSSYNMDAPNKSGTSYYQTNTWMQFNGFYGLYWPGQYGAHFYPNDASSYTQFRLSGSKNGYGGIYDSYSAVAGIMYDSAGNGGMYREANGRWYFYHYVGNNCTGINTSTTSASYGLYVEGAIYSTGDITAYSDVRKKTNIATIDSALDKVTKLRGVYYDRIDDLEKGRQVGVIAQEVNEVLPEAVTYAEDIDEYGVKYGNIVGVLIEAIKEQQKQIEELKGIINGITK